MSDNVKPFGIKRNLDFVKTSFYIMFRSFVEYKIHFYWTLITSFIWFLSQYLMIYIIDNSFSDVIGWDSLDFILLIGVVNLVWSAIGLFNWSNIVFRNLVLGNLNTMLTKPLNIKLKLYFYDLDDSGFCFVFLAFFYALFLIVYFKIQLYNIMIGLFVLVLTIITFTFFWFAIDSFNFVRLGLSYVFSPINEATNMLQFYPAQFFHKTKIKYLFNIIPLYFVSSLVVPIFRNKLENIYDLKIQFVLLLIICFLSLGILFFNWHYGLKRYEAFG